MIVLIVLLGLMVKPFVFGDMGGFAGVAPDAESFVEYRVCGLRGLIFGKICPGCLVRNARMW